MGGRLLPAALAAFELLEPSAPPLRFGAAQPASAGCRRSRNAPAKRRLRANRLHVGRRARRRHRRARKAA